MILFARIEFSTLNQKPNALAGKSWDFSHPWSLVMALLIAVVIDPRKLGANVVYFEYP
jgi:hypothetical protein